MCRAYTVTGKKNKCLINVKRHKFKTRVGVELGEKRKKNKRNERKREQARPDQICTDMSSVLNLSTL